MIDSHHRAKPRGTALMLAAMLFAMLSCTQAYADDEAKTRKQLNQLSSEMGNLRKLLQQFKGQQSELQNSLQKSEINIGQIQTKIRQIQQQLGQQQAELASLQQQRNQLQGAKKQQQQFIEQQVLAAYQTGHQKKIKVLLNQEKPEKVTRALTYYDYFNQARTEQIDSYIDVISKLNSVEPKIVEKTTSLSQAKNQLSDEYSKLLASQQTRKQNLATINSAIKSKDQQLQKMNKDRADLERVLAAVEQTIANISIPNEYQPFSKLKGKLAWPLKGKPSNRFGGRRQDTSLHWQGLAIPAAEGSHVSAIHYGRVVFSDWLRGSGLLIIIDHGDGYMSLYAHNQSLIKQTGDWVSPGEVIATVGNSGGQQQANLYFEIRHNGKPTDPSTWCKRV